MTPTILVPTILSAHPNAAMDAAPDIATDTATVVAVADANLRGQICEALQRMAVPVVEPNCAAGTIEDLLASVERLRPAILILGLSGLPGDPAAALTRLARLDYPPRVIAVSDSADPELILKTMRAGAAEFIYPASGSGTLEPGAVTDSLRRVLADCERVRPQDRSSGTVIGFVSAKGGCGATTLACHASGYLRQAAGKDVLLADLDFASGIIGTILQTPARYTVDDALQNLHRMDRKLWKALVGTTAAGLDVMPAPADQPSPVLPASRKMPKMLRFWRTHYDFTILDLGHGTTPMLLDVLESLDTLVLVATHELPALRQARQLMHSAPLRNFGAKRLKLVINRMPQRARMPLPELEKLMGHEIHSVLPNDYERLTEAYSEPRLLGANCELGTQLGRFAARLAGLAPAEKKPRRFFSFGRSA